jgi:hypothetical protein
VKVVNVMNKVNVVNVWKSATFTTYPYETKNRVNVVNVVPGYFASRRTYHAKHQKSRN